MHVQPFETINSVQHNPSDTIYKYFYSARTLSELTAFQWGFSAACMLSVIIFIIYIPREITHSLTDNQ